MCVLKNKRYKTYQTGFSFNRLGLAPGVGLCGDGGVQVFKNISEHGNVAFQIDGDDEHNRMQVHFLP